MAVSVGQAAARVVSRTAMMMAFQEMLNTCPTAENRRRLINSAHANGAISGPEYRALLTGGNRGS